MAPATPSEVLTLDDVIAAERRIRAFVHHTPLRHSTTFSQMTGAEVHLKFENLQRTGSFKIRGATNKILTLSNQERTGGVVCASAGNHAQGVALAAKLNGVNATVVMPTGAAIQKVEATRGYGAQVVLHGGNYDEAYEKALELQEARGLTFVHAYDDVAVMAGQGTLGLEILQDLPDVDVVISGVGGGGLISGIATAVKSNKPNAKVVGVQPERSASLPQSLKEGRIIQASNTDTIADGLATKHVGDQTFEIMRRLVDQAVTVTDDEIAHAILLLLERQKNVVEGAGAASVAALLSGKVRFPKKKVVCVISGGNIDINFLDAIITRGLQEEGRLLRFRTVLADKPGQLRGILGVVAQGEANVRDVRHIRDRPGLPLNRSEVEILVETKGPAHQRELLEDLKRGGYAVET